MQSLSALDEQLKSRRAAGPYYLGERLTALDIYSATAVNTMAPLAHEHCPMLPSVRSAFEWLEAELGDALPRSLVEHPDMMYARHLKLPMEL